MSQQLDHEKLDVYEVELQFVAWTTDLIVELGDSQESKKRRIAEAVDHLDRDTLNEVGFGIPMLFLQHRPERFSNHEQFSTSASNRSALAWRAR